VGGKVASAEAIRVLRNADWKQDIWSHAFKIEGLPFLLSAQVRPGSLKAKETAVVVEVAPAPRGLRPRTLLIDADERPFAPAASVGVRKCARAH
jgi:hypothetical protein